MPPVRLAVVARLALVALLVVAGLAPAAPRAWSREEAPADCSPGVIAAARAEFDGFYRQRNWTYAQLAIEPVWRTCLAERPLTDLTRARVGNDYALVLHHVKDTRACLEFLQDYGPGRTWPTPAMRALPAGLRAAMRDTYGVCRTFCDEPDAYTDSVCAWQRIEDQYNGMVQADFRSPPCPFAAPAGAVALPGKGPPRCLAVTPSARPFAYETADEDAAGEICPGLALLGPNGRRTALEIPAKSQLRTKRFCCLAPKLAVDRRGRIEVQPEENPPEDCLFGHREWLLQDVLRLDGTRLTLVHRLHRDD